MSSTVRKHVVSLTMLYVPLVILITVSLVSHYYNIQGNTEVEVDIGSSDGWLLSSATATSTEPLPTDYVIPAAASTAASYRAPIAAADLSSPRQRELTIHGTILLHITDCMCICDTI